MMDRREMYFMFCQFYVRAIEAVKPLVVRNPHMIDVRGRKKEKKQTSVLIYSKDFCNAM